VRNHITRIEALEQVARPSDSGRPWLRVTFEEDDDEAIRQAKRDAVGFDPAVHNLIQNTIIRGSAAAQ